MAFFAFLNTGTDSIQHPINKKSDEPDRDANSFSVRYEEKTRIKDTNNKNATRGEIKRRIKNRVR